jgi:hypothetical protein
MLISCLGFAAGNEPNSVPHRLNMMYRLHSEGIVGAALDSGTMIQKIVDPAEYVRRFCEEIGAPITARGHATAGTGLNNRPGTRRLFWRMYQYKGKPFVIRAYERILGRPPEPGEIQSAQTAFFEGRHSRTFMMLTLRFGDEGRLATSCNIVGLSALRVFWNVTHRRGRRIAPIAKER